MNPVGFVVRTELEVVHSYRGCWGTRSWSLAPLFGNAALKGESVCHSPCRRSSEKTLCILFLSFPRGAAKGPILFFPFPQKQRRGPPSGRTRLSPSLLFVSSLALFSPMVFVYCLWNNAVSFLLLLFSCFISVRLLGFLRKIWLISHAGVTMMFVFSSVSSVFSFRFPLLLWNECLCFLILFSSYTIFPPFLFFGCCERKMFVSFCCFPLIRYCWFPSALFPYCHERRFVSFFCLPLNSLAVKRRYSVCILGIVLTRSSSFNHW